MPEEISPHILHKCGPPSLLPCNEYHLSRVERLQCLGFKACSHGDTTALRRPEVWWPLSSIPKAPNSWVVFKDGHMHSDYYGIVGWNMLKHVETVVPPGEQKNIQKYQTSIAGCSSPRCSIMMYYDRFSSFLIHLHVESWEQKAPKSLSDLSAF